MATAIVLAISGRRMTVSCNGVVADYNIDMNAQIFLNDKKSKLADIENGDEVVLGGISKTGVRGVKATRDDTQLPKAITPNTTDHFPPVKGDVSLALQIKDNEEKAKKELLEAANAPNTGTDIDKDDKKPVSTPTGISSTSKKKS